MRLGKGWAKAVVGMTLLMGTAVTLPPRAMTQEATPDATKQRKVRTRVVPEYPTLAKQLEVTGKVKIEATISADGHVTSTKTVGGSPLLVSAAVDALKKWRFEPAPKESIEIIEFDFNGQN
ncbi:MAG TPA: energy transducer TonB [Verrucomicrobiae bacterium]|nr:energy transducer TonB [Verrucomicrobiae bacterium]